eukprot:scaffold13224_cov101-Isochrysis_galbana.AAC.2
MVTCPLAGARGPARQTCACEICGGISLVPGKKWKWVGNAHGAARNRVQVSAARRLSRRRGGRVHHLSPHLRPASGQASEQGVESGVCAGSLYGHWAADCWSADPVHRARHTPHGQVPVVSGPLQPATGQSTGAQSSRRRDGSRPSPRIARCIGGGGRHTGLDVCAALLPRARAAIAVRIAAPHNPHRRATSAPCHTAAANPATAPFPAADNVAGRGDARANPVERRPRLGRDAGGRCIVAGVKTAGGGAAAPNTSRVTACSVPPDGGCASYASNRTGCSSIRNWAAPASGKTRAVPGGEVTIPSSTGPKATPGPQPSKAAASGATGVRASAAVRPLPAVPPPGAAPGPHAGGRPHCPLGAAELECAHGNARSTAQPGERAATATPPDAQIVASPAPAATGAPPAIAPASPPTVPSKARAAAMPARLSSAPRPAVHSPRPVCGEPAVHQVSLPAPSRLARRPSLDESPPFTAPAFTAQGAAAALLASASPLAAARPPSALRSSASSKEACTPPGAAATDSAAKRSASARRSKATSAASRATSAEAPPSARSRECTSAARTERTAPTWACEARARWPRSRSSSSRTCCCVLRAASAAAIAPLSRSMAAAPASSSSACRVRSTSWRIPAVCASRRRATRAAARAAAASSDARTSSPARRRCRSASASSPSSLCSSSAANCT